VDIEHGQIGKHGMILEFTDPERVRRSATYLPEIAAQEGVQKSGT
jgi:AMMECR1 domain-containing protein